MSHEIHNNILTKINESTQNKLILNKNDDTFINNCKTQIYILYLNCKSLLYVLFSLNNILKYNDSYQYIDINECDTYIYIFGKKHILNLEWLRNNTQNIQYFSYRNNIPIPLSNNLTSDAGWGCMIRTGQMMLCQTLLQSLSNISKNEIISLFFDDPKYDFSVHKMTNCGEKYHIPVGKWFKPTSLGYTIKELVLESPSVNPYLNVVIAKDGIVYRNEIIQILNNKKKVLVLIPIMLGIDKIHESYYSQLLNCFEIQSNIGMIGGKPRQSFYFIGKQNTNIFFLDPHTIQPALIDIKDNIISNDREKINYTNISKLDPCMLLCFLISSYDDFEQWEQDINQHINNDLEYPIFSINDNEVNAENINDIYNNEVFSDCDSWDSI
jgi:cysteine protease ATG4